MSRLLRALKPLRRLPHITWGGDLTDLWAPIWEPDPRGTVRRVRSTSSCLTRICPSASKMSTPSRYGQ